MASNKAILSAIQTGIVCHFGHYNVHKGGPLNDDDLNHHLRSQHSSRQSNQCTFLLFTDTVHEAVEGNYNRLQIKSCLKIT